MEESVKSILTQFCNNNSARLIHFTFNSDFNYTCEIRAHYDEKKELASEFCDRLITEFGDLTATNWIVRYTYPNVKRLKFRKVFVCQHSTFGKIKNRARCDTRIRDKNCNAKIDFKIKLTNRNTVRKDSLLKEGLDTVVMVSFKHSHRVNVAEAYSYLRLTDNVQKKFLQYFDDGMGPTAAKSFHEISLMEADEFEKDLANAKVNPTARQIKHLYNKWRTVNFGTRSEGSIFKVIETKKHLYEAKGIGVIIKENPLIIVILTPIMKRAHEQSFSKEIVFVDSSGSCDQMNTCVTFMYAASKIGAIPLACILHTAQTESNYALAFSVLKEHLGINGFGGQGYPSLFMTDDSTSERNALSSVYPSSRLLLCSFHLSQALWRWLWASENHILNEDRKPIMKMFQSILYSSSIEEAETQYNIILRENSSKKYPQLLSHLESIWERRSEWCLCLRKDVLTRGNNTNNYVEASIRIFKDIVLQRCKAFNACALVDFIVSVFETYHKKHLLEFANSRRSQPKLSYLAFSKKAKSLDVHKIDSNTYRISSGEDRHLFYTAYVDIALCDCPFGQGGRFCKHLCAIQERFSLVLNTSPLLRSEDRIILAKLALGNEASKDFYMDMDMDIPINMPTSTSDRVSDNYTGNIEQSINIPMNIEEEKSVKTQRIGFTEGPSDPLHIREVAILKSNFVRISEIALNNPNSDLTKAIHNINLTLSQLTTATQVQSYFCQMKIAKKYCYNRGRQIGVQPTSKSRRKIRPGFTSGAKRIQSGRPSKNEVKQVTKKRRNLSTNVNKNTPNAKSH